MGHSFTNADARWGGLAVVVSALSRQLMSIRRVASARDTAECVYRPYGVRGAAGFAGFRPSMILAARVEEFCSDQRTLFGDNASMGADRSAPLQKIVRHSPQPVTSLLLNPKLQLRLKSGAKLGRVPLLHFIGKQSFRIRPRCPTRRLRTSQRPNVNNCSQPSKGIHTPHLSAPRHLLRNSSRPFGRRQHSRYPV